MAAKQYVNNSSLYLMLCMYNFFDKRNQNIISLSTFCEQFFFIYFVFVFFFNSEVPENRSELRLSGTSEFLFKITKKNPTKKQMIERSS